MAFDLHSKLHHGLSIQCRDSVLIILITYLGSTPFDYYNLEPEDAFLLNMMPSSEEFSFKGDATGNFNFGNGYFGNGQVDTQNNCGFMTLEGEGYTNSSNFSYHPQAPAYIPPSENWSITYSDDRTWKCTCTDVSIFGYYFCKFYNFIALQTE